MTAYQFIRRLSLVVLLFAVVHTTAVAQEHCGTDKAVALQIAKHPELRAQMEAIRQQALNTPPASGKQATLITIPVIFHVVHNGEPEGTGSNLSDAQVLSQLEVLNEDYRRLNADVGNTPTAFQSIASDIEVEFCLALRAPDGSYTSGIERVDGGRSFWSISDIDGILKPSTVWNRNKYLNIWSCNIGGPDQGTLGYASPPGQPANTDGVVVSFQYFGRGGSAQSPYNQGRTATHEVGHWLGLIHVWGPVDPNTANCADDDGVSDTPVQSKANYGCPTFPKISCSNGPNGDMFMNYMDYTNDACMNLFTAGQKTVMRNVLTITRDSITLSDACTQFPLDIAIEDIIHPADTTCTPDVRPLVRFRNVGTQTLTSALISYVTDQSNFGQLQWNGSVAPGEEFYVTLPLITLSVGPHELEVYSDSPNGQTDGNGGNDGQTVNFVVLDNLVVDFNLPFTEDFEGLFPDYGWEVFDVDNDGGWQQDAGAGGFGNSAQSLMLDVSTAGAGTLDEVSLPFLSLTSDDQYPVLSFDYAFAPISNATSNRLEVAVSLDCGGHWEKIWEKSGSDLATVTPVSGAYIPAATDWRTVFVYADIFAGHKKFQYKFSYVNGSGNRIYLDNVNLGSQTVGLKAAGSAVKLSLFPNPAERMVHLEATGTSGKHTLALYNMAGQQLFAQELTAQGNLLKAAVDVSHMPKGMVIVKLTHEAGNSSYQKLIIQ